MSRYSLKSLAERADVFEVAIGWDPGLGTYFAIVFGVPEPYPSGGSRLVGQVNERS